jgi:hypothetical protein
MPGPTGRPVTTVTVCDGQRAIQLNDAAREYFYLPPFRRTGVLAKARDLPRGLDWHTGIDLLGPPVRFAGRQVTNAIPCTAWKCVVPGIDGKVYEQCTVWVRASDGRPVRSYWTRQQEATTCDVLSCNEPFDDKLFATNPPEGYTLREPPPPPSPPDGRPRRALENGLVVDVGYLLPDRSLVAAIRTGARRPAWSEPAFAHLTFGSEVTGLLPWFDSVAVRDFPTMTPVADVVVRHLAMTKKDGVIYEWVLFVPTAPVPARRTISYEMKWEKHNVGRSVSYHVLSPEEFDEMVRGNMGELSDEGRPPVEVTYDAVMSLVNAAHQAARGVGATSQPASGK